MMKKVYILDEKIINVGDWDYQYDENQTAMNPLPDGAIETEKEMEYDDNRGWHEAGTQPAISEKERIAQLEQENLMVMMALVELHSTILKGGGTND